VAPAGADALEQSVRQAVTIANERDLRQDALFGVRQLADIALRALSPGVNDPTTAHTCIGYLRAVLEEVAARPALRPQRWAGRLLVTEATVFPTYLDIALTEVAEAAAGQPSTGPTILEALAAVRADAVRHGRIENAADCENAALAIGPVLLDGARSERDRERIRDALERATAARL
jgi:uncharacterized membrane protein